MHLKMSSEMSIMVADKRKIRGAIMDRLICTEAIIDKVTDLRHRLHACPEVSGEEVKTKAMLQAFLKEHTSLELYPCGKGFYAAHPGV